MTRHEPLLVTVRVRRGLASLRGRDAFRVIRSAFARGAERFGFRLVHFSVQSNHVHLLVEAEGGSALARGMQGLLVRVARGLNRLWRRTGAVVDDHFHARALRTPREVRAALVYVLQNARKHGVRLAGLDPCSSARAFDGWDRPLGRREGAALDFLARARSWLLATGWRRHGRIAAGERPAT